MIIKDGVLSAVSEDDFIKGHLVVPNTVHTISENALKSVVYLKSIELPSSLKKIEKGAFARCDFLSSITIPSSVKEIDDNAFYNCRSLKNVTIENGVERIGSNVFSATPLTSIAIPSSVKEIGNGAFALCNILKRVQLPNNLEVISANLFDECTALSSVEIPKTVKKIESNAFSKCYGLKKINLPDSIESISENAFASSGLKTVSLPKKITSIENATFADCKSLKRVNFPSSLQKIGKSAFSDCFYITNISLPSSLKIIDDKAFENCVFLSSVNIPENVEFIGEYAFHKCSIKSLSLPKSVKNISEYAFYECPRLKNIDIQANISTIEPNTFALCDKLENVSLPSGLKTIKPEAFSDCAKLSSITIPFGVTSIEESAFIGCKHLSHVEIPDSVRVIGPSAFQECEALESIFIPSSVEVIKKGAFSSCPRLNNVEFSEGLKTIEHNAFDNCDRLENIKLPKTVKYIESDSFGSCFFDTFFIPEGVKKYEHINNLQYFNHFAKVDDGFIIAEYDLDVASTKLEKTSIDMSILLPHWKHKDILLREQHNENISKFYNSFVSTLPYKEADEFIKSHNFTFFKQLTKRYSFNTPNLYKFLYNIGGVSVPFSEVKNVKNEETGKTEQIETGKQLDYAQKSVSFILELFAKKKAGVAIFNSIGSSMDIKGFNKEFTDFFIGNFEELVTEERANTGFIARCYNNFEAVQRTNTNNHGNQRQLKPTVEKFKNFFKENKYNGVTEETKHIARIISPYYEGQQEFENAVKILTEKEQNGTPDHILSVPLTDNKPISTNPFANIDEMAEKIENMQASTIENLTSTANKQFTFEWLAKNDPTNLILGKLCSCCAHLEGVGYGIVRASIIHPNLQNMVIRDETNEIIAKATLYINPDEGYGVINSVQMYDGIHPSKHKFVYDEFNLGVKRFAEEYNKEHPDKPLKQINVGMGFNALSHQIYKNNRKSFTILTPLDFSRYGNKESGQAYAGDSFSEQCIIWKPEQSHVLKINSHNVLEK